MTTSEKIRVLNTPEPIKFYDAAGAVIVGGVPTALTDVMVVEGYGRFPLGNMKKVKMHRAVVASVDSKDYIVAAPAGLVAGDAVRIEVRANSNRATAGVVTAAGFGDTRNFSITTAPLTAVTPTAIAAALVLAYPAFVSAFLPGEHNISLTAGGTITRIKIAALAGFEDLIIERVLITRISQGVPFQQPLPLLVSTINSVGFEGRGQGKFLEESIRMSTNANTSITGIDNAEGIVDRRGMYTNISFSLVSYRREDLSLYADHGQTILGTPVLTSFSLFLNEVSMLAAGQAIENIAKGVVLVSGSDAHTTVNGSTALTVVEERTEALVTTQIKAVATAAAFIL